MHRDKIVKEMTEMRPLKKDISIIAIYLNTGAIASSALKINGCMINSVVTTLNVISKP